MKSSKLPPSYWLWLLLFAAVTATLVGCASNEPGNVSARPWNSPKGWESGIPTGLTEGR